MSHYEAIVLGVGGVGSAALYHLARRGVRTLGLDRFEPGHDRGSSHGETRIIRQAYFEHADYVPLLLRAYELWNELEHRCGQRLYHQVGLLQVGPPEGEVVQGVMGSARRHGLPIDELSPQEAARRWPGFAIPPGSAALFEHRAGYLRVEACVRAHVRAALALGAELHSGEAITAWHPAADGFAVLTERGRYRARRPIIAGGAWNGDLLADLGLDLHIRRKPQYWYRAASGAYQVAAGCPAFLFDTPAGKFYGFPQMDDQGVKVAQHTGGNPVSDPLSLDQAIDAGDRQAVEAFSRQHLPELTSELVRHSPCMYTLSADEHFIIDRHPTMPGLALAAGLSGHGFKFTSVLGELLTGLVLDERSPLPIEFLSLNRPALAHKNQAV
jgi:sarcosine oxidase